MDSIIKVMVNGLPGNMARQLVELVVNDGRFKLVPYSLTGPEIAERSVAVGGQEIALIRPDQREEAIAAMGYGQGRFISVDFTHPKAANINAKFYCAHGFPFVMGTTGGDRQRLNETVVCSYVSAVIAPNMAKQVVGFQSMMEFAAENFPDLFAGYSLEIWESHQANKADTSGTAKVMVGYFAKLGVPFSAELITMIRHRLTQKVLLGVPEKFLDGHGWHTYTLRSPDGTVMFQFTHNVNGRDIYARGALDAIVFLAKKVEEGVKGKVFTMIDVLKG